MPKSDAKVLLLLFLATGAAAWEHAAARRPMLATSATRCAAVVSGVADEDDALLKARLQLLATSALWGTYPASIKLVYAAEEGAHLTSLTATATRFAIMAIAAQLVAQSDSSSSSDNADASNLGPGFALAAAELGLWGCGGTQLNSLGLQELSAAEKRALKGFSLKDPAKDVRCLRFLYAWPRGGGCEAARFIAALVPARGRGRDTEHGLSIKMVYLFNKYYYLLRLLPPFSQDARRKAREAEEAGRAEWRVASAEQEVKRLSALVGLAVGDEEAPAAAPAPAPASASGGGAAAASTAPRPMSPSVERALSPGPADGPIVGSRVMLVLKSEVRFEGTITHVDPLTSTLALARARCFGTEERPAARHVPPSAEAFEHISFTGSDIKDLKVFEPSVPPTPALAGSLTEQASVAPRGHKPSTGPAAAT